MHTRRPLHLLRDLGLRGFIGFHAVFSGLLFSAILYPWSCVLLAWQLASSGSTAPSALMIACAVNMLVSFAAAILLSVAVALRRRRWRLALSALWTPVYWLLISVAAHRAVLDFIIRPHHWKKTAHTGAGRNQIDASGRCRGVAGH